tara:strand:+ start:925 stop:1320 length:396 start_codon:yes stop_codon:yes gene_type:complete
MGRRRGRRNRQKKQQGNKYKVVRGDHEWSQEVPVIEGFAQGKKKNKKQKKRKRRSLQEHVVGQAHDKAEHQRSKRKTAKIIRPEVPVVLEDIGATSCTHRIVPAVDSPPARVPERKNRNHGPVMAITADEA